MGETHIKKGPILTLATDAKVPILSSLLGQAKGSTRANDPPASMLQKYPGSDFASFVKKDCAKKHGMIRYGIMLFLAWVPNL